MIFYPPPVDKVHAPLRANPGSATDRSTTQYVVRSILSPHAQFDSYLNTSLYDVCNTFWKFQTWTASVMKRYL